MGYEIDLRTTAKKYIYPLDENFRGSSRDGEEISFTNYYMQRNGEPFFGVSGEFHYSRMWEQRWEDELIKMKQGGINTVSTYIFWIHHEEEEGEFDFTGRRNLRRFIQLCRKHGLYVILRVGPFDHGEARNGGIPDWMYGKPFEVRKLSQGFLYYVRRLYTQIAAQAEGLFFKDNGPVIGVQIDNEYMHSSAPWEMTAGTSNEWVFGGDEGEAYMLGLKELAAECGLLPVFYTCTGWGGAIAPKSMLPLWGGYAFRPWLFYSYKGKHPSTEEYVYQNFHDNRVTCTNDFRPSYLPEEKPYACCEMGGGMMCSYYYRFQYPYKSVDAMANIKMASGCNFLGYYMFQGGSNPVGKHGTFMNEGQVSRISYDYQAALGEFGQVRESYRRLKNIHYFTAAFGGRLCDLPTVLPQGASRIRPEDMDTLRYAVRSDGRRGFLFINNYQDHEEMPDRRGQVIRLLLSGETLEFDVDIDGDENGILPFHFDMGGIELIQATAQPVTVINETEEPVYVFFTPQGMKAGFVFEEGVLIDGRSERVWQGGGTAAELFRVEKGEKQVCVLVLDRKMADRMYRTASGELLFTDAALLEDENGFRLETEKHENIIYGFQAKALARSGKVRRLEEQDVGPLQAYSLDTGEVCAELKVEKTARSRYVLSFPEGLMEGVKDMRLRLDYEGDIGHAFIDGKLVNDNFCNGAVWEIGLKEYAGMLREEPMVIYITPLREGANVNVESAMAARMEEVRSYVGELRNASLQPVYDIRF